MGDIILFFLARKRRFGSIAMWTASMAAMTISYNIGFSLGLLALCFVTGLAVGVLERWADSFDREKKDVV